MGSAVVALVVLAVLVMVCLCIFGLTVAGAWLEAYAEFKSRPREPMDWCSKHGFFRQKYALPVPGVPTVKMCPTCFWDSLQNSVKEPTIEVKKK